MYRAIGKSIKTPSEVMDAIVHGVQRWLKRQDDPGSSTQALTAGSLKGTDMLLTMAFNEQFHTIGWINMFYGRLSKLWGKTVSEILKSPQQSFSRAWTAQTVLFLWKYTRSLWTHMNQVVHGTTAQEVAARMKDSIHSQVHGFYAMFQTNPNFILTRHHYLFTSRSLEQRLLLDTDSITCWIRSVQDAQQALESHNTNLRLQPNRFFAPFYEIGQARSRAPSPSTDSTYQPPSQASSITTDDLGSLATTSDTREDVTVSTINTSHYSRDYSTTMSSLGTFITTGSNDPPLHYQLEH
jgi:hypothetical protein